jgi:MoaA/NifB/PqqE/SkfB family radical SAM enzyme
MASHELVSAGSLPGEITRLPILLLHVHSHCNCRCVMCDIWKRKDKECLTSADLERHRNSLRELQVEQVVLTGGEPLLHEDFAAICAFFRQMGIRITLLTTGLLLEKTAVAVSNSVDELIISLDGPRDVHDRIRRVPGAFDRIAQGVAAVRALNPALPIAARCTVQSENHALLEETVHAARELGLCSISFLAVDVSSHAFNRSLVWPDDRQHQVALSVGQVAVLQEQLARLADARMADRSPLPFIVESPEKLQKIAHHFRAQLGERSFAAPACNAPWVSAVLELGGALRPCFFHPVTADASSENLQAALNSESARRFRQTLDIATNPTCSRCVCSLNYVRN